MLSELDSKYLVEVKSLMENGYMKLTNPVDTILTCLMNLGFTSVRYWTIVQDDIEKEIFLVLSRAKGDINLENYLGYRMEFSESYIFEEKPVRKFDRTNMKTCVFAHDNETGRNQEIAREINQILNLNDRYSVHIPVLCHGLLHGQLSASFNANNRLLERAYTLIMDNSYKDSLSILGMMLGDYKQLHAQKKLANAIDSFEQKEYQLVKSRDSRGALEMITGLIREIVSAEFATSFDYNWYNGSLIRAYMASAKTPSKELDDCKEIFSSDKFLTGKAYTNEHYRYVYNLCRLRINRPELIHEELFEIFVNNSDDYGGCMMFCLIGKREHKSLIRVLNKQNDSRVPFDFFERESLEQACTYFSKAYDDIIAYSQLDRLQNFSVRITNNISNIPQICKLVYESLVGDWVLDVVFFGRLNSEVNTTIFYKKNNDSFVSITLHSSSFLDECLAAKDTIWISFCYSDDSPNKSLEKILFNRGYIGMLVFPNDFENYVGGIGVPLKTTPIFNESENNIPKLHESNIKAYASVISRLIWFSRNIMVSDNAQNLVGQIGHEIKSPIRRIGTISDRIIDAIDDMKKSYPDFSDKVFNNFVISKDNTIGYRADNFYDFLAEQSEELKGTIKSSKMMIDVASTLAQMSNYQIELTFEKVDIYRLCKRISNEIRGEIDVLQGDRGLSCDFIFNEAFKSLHPLVCDKYVVEKIIENIFRNALKYSISPGSNKPIKIEVQANPQVGSCLNIFVINWGLGIEERNHENIFLPFNRGYDRNIDRVRARKGMGIGLYISRIFSMSHGGNVSLISSESKFNDPLRKNEGWSTKFEIRLSDKFIPGTYKYDILNNKNENSTR